MLGSISMWLTVVKYGLTAVAVAGLTWYALSTIQRAHEADVLEAILKRERAIAASKAEFEVKVDAVRQSVEGRLDRFATQLDSIGAQRRERIIERLPANTRPCLTADVVRLLNGSSGGYTRLPAPTGNAHGGGQVITRTAGSGLR
jgi:hypothetical protein